MMANAIIDGREYFVDKRGVRKTRWGEVTHYEIQRADGSEIEGFDELYAVKTKFCTDEKPALEVYPSEDRLVNDVNARHLWVLEDSDVPFGISREDPGITRLDN